MIYRLECKKIIILLTIGFVVMVSMLWYKQEITNKVVPKKANYVLNKIEWRKHNV